MNRSRLPLFILALLVISLFLFWMLRPSRVIGHQQQDSAGWQAGVSAAAINPPVGAFIAGDKPNRRFTGIRDSLFAKAVVITDGRNAMALVTLDCIGLMHPEGRLIRERAAQLIGQPGKLPAEHILVSSTHTHAGPDVVGLWGAHIGSSGVDTAYMAMLVETAARQVERAWRQQVPVTLWWQQGEAGHEWVANICNEEIDRSLTAVQLRQANGRTLATLTNFACHPTFLDGNQTEVSSDYVGAFYRRLREQLGGEHLFLQGAIGGWVQPTDQRGVGGKVDIRGTELADSVIRLVGKANRLMGDGIEVKTQSFRLPVDNASWRQLAVMGTIKRAIADSVDTELAWSRIGQWQLATHPGETAPVYGLETKKLMQGPGPRMVLGLAMDALGYILKPEFFTDSTRLHAGYLTSMSLGVKTGPIMIEYLRQIIRQDD